MSVLVESFLRARLESGATHRNAYAYVIRGEPDVTTYLMQSNKGLEIKLLNLHKLIL